MDKPNPLNIMNKKIKNTIKLLSVSSLLIGIPVPLIAQDAPTVPDKDSPDVPVDYDGLLETLEALQAEFLNLVQNDEFVSSEARAAAIVAWLEENRETILEIDATQEEIDAAGDVVDPEEITGIERADASQEMVDLGILLEEKLANIETDNEELEENLAAAQADLEDRLAALEAARAERTANAEAARELARQMQEEARLNSDGDRRVDDDVPAGVGG